MLKDGLLQVSPNFSNLSVTKNFLTVICSQAALVASFFDKAVTDLGSLLERLSPILEEKGLLNMSSFRPQLTENIIVPITAESPILKGAIPLDIVRHLSGHDEGVRVRKQWFKKPKTSLPYTPTEVYVPIRGRRKRPKIWPLRPF